MRISDWSSDVCSSDLSGARLVISADRAPHMLDAVDPRILSRLAGGLVADIQPADLDLRLAILERRRLEAKDSHVPAAVIDFLARDRKTTPLNSSHSFASRIPSSA